MVVNRRGGVGQSLWVRGLGDWMKITITGLGLR